MSRTLIAGAMVLATLLHANAVPARDFGGLCAVADVLPGLPFAKTAYYWNGQAWILYYHSGWQTSQTSGIHWSCFTSLTDQWRMVQTIWWSRSAARAYTDAYAYSDFVRGGPQ